MAHALLSRGAQGNHGGTGTEEAAAGLLPRVAGSVWCALALWLLVSNLFVPSYGFSRYETWAALLAGAAVLALMLGIPWLLDLLDRLLRFRWIQVMGSVLGWAAVFAVLMRFADAVRLPPDWDAAVVFFSARGLALEGGPEAVDGNYFQANPNNTLLMLLLSRYLVVADGLGAQDLRQSVAYLGAALLFCGVLLTYAAAALLGGRRAARMTLVPSIILIVLSPWLPVFYSDTAALPFTISIFCLLVVAGRCRLPGRLLLWAAAGALSAVGYGVKPTVLIVLVAAALVTLLSPRRRSWGKDLLTSVLSVAVAAGCFAGTSAVLGAWTGSLLGKDSADKELAMPFTHFLKVGAQQYPGRHGDYYGAYNEQDRIGTQQIADPQERFDAGVEAYRERVAAMGPWGYAGFLNAKLRWMTGDGSFFSWGEGRMTADDFIADDPLSRTVQDFYGPGRPGFGVLLNVWQGTWFLVLALCGAGLFLRGPPLNSRGAVTARIALLGLFVFLALSEGRARFLYLYVPFFIVLGSLSMQRLAAGAWGPADRRRLSRQQRARDTPPPPSPDEVVE